MRLPRLGLLNRGQKGFTLIELVIALAITGAITSGITMSIFQTLNYDARGKARMVAVKQVENAVHHIIRDVQMAQIVEPDLSTDGFPLTLTWVEWDNTENEVIYSKAAGELRRSHSEDSGIPQEAAVARYLNSDAAATNCAFDDDEWRFTLKVTATVVGYPEDISETRDVEVTPRPN